MSEYPKAPWGKEPTYTELLIALMQLAFMVRSNCSDSDTELLTACEKAEAIINEASKVPA